MMQRTEQKSDRSRAVRRRLLAVVVLAAVLALLLSQSVFAQNSYVITDGDNVTVYQSYSSNPDEVLEEIGIELNEEDTYTTSYTDGVSTICIQRMQLVTVNYCGELADVGTYGETVGELLDRLDISVGANDTLSYDRDSLTFDGMVIDIVRKEVEVYEYDTVVPYDTNYYEDPELAPGEEIVLIEGVNGVNHCKAQIIRENGVEISREVVEETVRVQAVNSLVIRGPQTAITEQSDAYDFVVPEDAEPCYTVQGNTITTMTGATYTFTSTLQVSATAYSCEGRTGICYSGTVARVGAIAVDPRVIPLGSKMYIVSNDGEYVYGYCVAEDIGGGIKGNRVDLYFDTFAECYQFGVRSCTVYILSE